MLKIFKAISNLFQPDDTDAEIGKTKKLAEVKNDYGKLETDDELEARKAWHESRFLKNAQMNKSSTPKDSYFHNEIHRQNFRNTLIFYNLRA